MRTKDCTLLGLSRDKLDDIRYIRSIEKLSIFVFYLNCNSKLWKGCIYSTCLSLTKKVLMNWKVIEFFDLYLINSRLYVKEFMHKMPVR